MIEDSGEGSSTGRQRRVATLTSEIRCKGGYRGFTLQREIERDNLIKINRNVIMIQ